VRERATGRDERIEAAAAFVFIGLSPNTGFLKGALDLDERGFVLTSQTLESSVRGVFAAGDCRRGSTKQIASAVGEGATAAISIRHYLEMDAPARDAVEA